MDDIDVKRLAAGLVLAAQSGVESLRERWQALPVEAKRRLIAEKDAARESAEIVQRWLEHERKWESVRQQARELVFWCQWSLSDEVLAGATERVAAMAATLQSMERTSNGNGESDTDSSAA